ncbi:unnamed protein product [Dracunculus medinensis]|uniref:RING-type domain-containing protein n=1 Tax=Dracunculus medinensis TaxID=318479 RepID=A0A158Q341_DRAME|nr:unnamed protein product [Dracunculus medinensis]
MADECGVLSISEQLRLAKDMGYTDEDIMNAVSMNCDKDGSYRPFSSTNAMIDMLTRVQKACSSPKHQKKTCIFADNEYGPGRSSQSRNPCSTVRRTTSFHNSSPLRPFDHFDDLSASSLHELRVRPSAPFQLQRLLDAFDKERKNFSEESKRSVQMLEDRCRLFADNQVLWHNRLFDKECEIKALKAQIHDHSSLSEHLKLTKAKLDAELLENKSKTDQIRVLTEQAEVVKKQHDSEIREKEKMISDLLIKLNSVEETNKSLKEINEILQKEIEELKQILVKKQSDIEKCNNYLDEIRKAEQLVEQIRLERDEVMSLLNKIPTCVICLDKRPQMLYMPCSHFICCETCGSRFEHCPTCRQKICGKITSTASSVSSCLTSSKRDRANPFRS